MALQKLNPLYSLSVTHREPARLAFHNFPNSLLDVAPAELTIQCFIRPTGSLTVNGLKMVILLSGNTTWHGCRPTLTHTGTKAYMNARTSTEDATSEGKCGKERVKVNRISVKL